MKYRVKIANSQYEVEIVDLNARPVIAYVNGEAVEVWPEAEEVSPVRAEVRSPAPGGRVSPPISGADGSAKFVRAPIPGVIVSISVKPGSEVKPGDELCLLEAMKMKNSIRASRAGRISAVHISVGQTVKHHDVMLEYGDSPE